MRKRRILTLAILTLILLLWDPSAFATIYYVDYSTGSDSNNGTSKSTPWKHAPGMQGTGASGGAATDACTGTCASTTPVAGDSIILKGGVTWPVTVLPWYFSWAGSSTTSGSYGCAGSGCIYVGVDPTWNTGQVNSVITTRDFGGCGNAGSTPTAAFSGGGGSSAAATATMLGGVANFADGSTYDVAYWTVSNRGSGYTSNPTVTVSGTGCRNITAIADIHRAIIDEGAPGADWTVTTPPFSIPSPVVFIGNFVIVDSLQIQNMQWSYSSISPQFSGISMSGQSVTASNNFFHGMQPDTASAAMGIGDSMSMLSMSEITSEAANNYLENGDASFVCSTSICGWGDFGNLSATNAHDNHINFFLWSIKAQSGCGGCGPGGTLNWFNNEIWAGISSSGTGHLNFLYTGVNGWTHNIYNNIGYDNVGSTNQLTPGSTANTTYNIFNNVIWNTGSGGSIFQPDLAATSPSVGVVNTFNFWNNTLGATGSGSPPYKGAVIATGACSGTQCSATQVNLYNNYAITDQSANHWFLMTNPVNHVNGISSPTNTTPDSANYIASLTTSNGNGYTVTNGFNPISTSVPTQGPNFLGKNETSNCSGVVAALCTTNSDPGALQAPFTLPASGDTWPAGAREFPLGGGSTTGSVSAGAAKLQGGAILH